MKGGVMKDSCGKEIIPMRERLSVHRNRHTNCDGTSWGWIEGCKGNICWSNNKSFNEEEAQRFVQEYNANSPTYAQLKQELADLKKLLGKIVNAWYADYITARTGEGKDILEEVDDAIKEE
jgi:hypothetical protein